MKKVLLVLIGLLVPFFSTADIFTDSQGSTLPPEIEIELLGDCMIVPSVPGVTEYECKSLFVDYFKSIYSSNANSSFTEVYRDSITVMWHIYVTWVDVNGDNRAVTQSNQMFNGITPSETKQCPPTGLNHTNWTYEIYGDSQNTGTATLERCADPALIPTFDTCDINDSLNVQVTTQDACYIKNDLSSCSVSAVDVGGGNQVYMGSEGNCYTDPLPDVSSNPTLGNTPVNDGCVNNGGLLACAEDPANVCDSSGSTYGGGSTNNCQAGCGYVNDAFLCYDIDTDSDGLPDYNDPDIDGDGIANGNDLDANGDGTDDPIFSDTGGSSAGGSTTVNVDLTPVVSELKKLNDKFTPTAVDSFNQNGELDQLNTDYNSEITGFSAKTSTQLGFQDTLTLANSSALATSLPVQQCQNYNIPVGFFGDFTLDTCTLATKVQPFLTWFFGLLTAWYIFFTINKALSEGI